ncbi:hypothetical protein L218DRAFT_996709 [Marasmius fiardii PR-910]|nr:hypothetical protein L218DRAFT_996709 [Marasmius fiardii PR-910]
MTPGGLHSNSSVIQIGSINLTSYSMPESGSSTVGGSSHQLPQRDPRLLADRQWQLDDSKCNPFHFPFLDDLGNTHPPTTQTLSLSIEPDSGAVILLLALQWGSSAVVTIRDDHDLLHGVSTVSVRRFQNADGKLNYRGGFQVNLNPGSFTRLWSYHGLWFSKKLHRRQYFITTNGLGKWYLASFGMSIITGNT